jgi:hypothetical protein
VNKEPDKNNLIFDTFIQAKNALKDYPGGSLVRLNSNDGFYIKLPNNKAAIKPQPYKKIDIAPQIHKNIDIEPKLPEHEGKKDVNNLLYSKNELKNLAKDSIKQIKQKQAKREAELKRLQEENQKKALELKAKIKRNTPNYNKDPVKTSYSLKKSTKKRVEPDFKRYIDEALGTRDDFKSMRGKQSFGNKTGNH